MFGRKQRVITRTYASKKAFERDANKLWKQGYAVTSVTTRPGSVLVGHTVAKWVTLFGVLMGPTRKPDVYDATYTLTTPIARSAPSFLY